MSYVEGELLDRVPDQQGLEQLASVYEEAYPEAGTGTLELMGAIQSPETDLYALKRYDSDFAGEYVAAGMIEYGQGAVVSELTEAAVRSDFQGEGLGTKLFSDRAEIARMKGNGKVITWTSTENPAAQAVAEKEGFLPSGVEVNRIPPEADDPIHNILMVDPKTLYNEQKNVYTTEEMLDAVGSILDTEIGDSLDREVQLLENPEGSEYGFIAENVRGEGSTLTYGMQKFGESRRAEQGPVSRVAGDSTIEQAWRETLDEGYTTAYVNINEPGSSAAATYLVAEEGLVPTGINPFELVGADGRSFRTADTVILSEMERSIEVGATENVAEWLEAVELPVYAEERLTDNPKDSSSQGDSRSPGGTLDHVKNLFGRFLD